ncbi:MAG: glycoside hydrolase family 3 C-terminal domain-containing protein, partial [Pacificimonas sp.]
VPPGVPDSVKEALPDRPQGQSETRGGDRASLDLPDDQIALIDAAAETGKPIIVVIVAGSAVMVERWHEKAGAILQTFYAGMEGGHALVRLLFGDVSPSAKLPFSVASDADHYPWFDRTATEIDYDMWHGYTKLARDGNAPRYAFGHGLSYATFSYRGLQLHLAPTGVDVVVSVTNEGDIPADEVVQLYVRTPGNAVERAERQLTSFARVALEPGETKTVCMSVPYDDLAYYDEATGLWTHEPGDYLFAAGASSALDMEAGVRIRL